MTNTYTLKAINEFNCIGNKCEFSCCSNWKIKLETEILDRWNNLKDAPLKSKLLKSIETNIKDGKEIISLSLNESGDCYHLDEQGKCEIHSELGPKFQPITCKQYPRENYQSNSISISSANMSCPEVARLVVENSGDDIFVEHLKFDDDLNQVGSGENALENYLDKWARLIMQANNIPISVKLYYMGKVINDLNNFSEKVGLTEPVVTDICKHYAEHLNVILKAVTKKEFKPDPVSSGWYWDIIYNFSNQTFDKLQGYYELSDPIAPLNIPLQKRSEKDYKRLYSEVRNLLDETRPLFDNLYPGLEKYLRTLFVNLGFPWNPLGGNFIASYLKTVFHFSSTWYLLAIIGKAKGSLNMQDLARVIYHVEHDYYHNPRVDNTMKNNPALFDIGNFISSLLDLN